MKLFLRCFESPQEGDCFALVFRRKGAEVFDDTAFILIEVLASVGRFGLIRCVRHLLSSLSRLFHDSIIHLFAQKSKGNRRSFFDILWVMEDNSWLA